MVPKQAYEGQETTYGYGLALWYCWPTSLRLPCCSSRLLPIRTTTVFTRRLLQHSRTVPPIGTNSITTCDVTKYRNTRTVSISKSIAPETGGASGNVVCVSQPISDNVSPYTIPQLTSPQRSHCTQRSSVRRESPVNEYERYIEFQWRLHLTVSWRHFTKQYPSWNKSIIKFPIFAEPYITEFHVTDIT